jgi:hypothetical protein
LLWSQPMILSVICESHVGCIEKHAHDLLDLGPGSIGRPRDRC